MPADNAQVLGDAVAHLNATGGFAWDLYAPDVVFRTRPELEGSNTFRGHAGLTQALAGFTEIWGESIRLEIVEVIGSGDALVVVIRVRVRGEGSGVELQVLESWATWMAGGRIQRIEQYGTTPEALAAVGLAEG